MSEEALLTELCSVCNTNASKYCCPGCSARTCSLPCYKRHQQWAQCSGKRDPTAYVKKSQLATPAGIDHDFNFLSGIERGLQKAERDVTARGVSTAPAPPRKVPRKGETTARVLEDAGVTVVRAPVGLSRQKENSTAKNKHGNIIWTVEWIHPDKKRSVLNTSERTLLWEAYRDCLGLPRIKKRKREVNDQTPTEHDGDAASPAKRRDAAGSHAGDDGCPTGEGGNPQPSKIQGSADSKPGAEANREVGLEVAPSDSRTDGPVPEGPASDITSDPVSEFHFFLHRPRTSSSRPVLIPLNASAILRDCLRGHTVLEFPTIYVFSDPVPSTEDFVLEKEYLKQEEEERKELEEAMRNVKPEALRAMQEAEASEQAAGEVDSQKILDVLKQDLGGAL